MNNEPTIIEAFDTELLPANENYIQLKEIAKKTTNFIYQQMHNLTKKLEDAKRLSSDAECADDDGWFNRKFGNGETAIEKRSKLNTKVNILQNEAIAEIAYLVQASVQFAKNSTRLNRAMIEELSNLTNDGFDDVHNEIQKIHDEKVLQYLAQIKEGLEANQKADKQNETLTQNRIYIDQQQKSINDNTQSILLYKDLIAKIPDQSNKISKKF